MELVALLEVLLGRDVSLALSLVVKEKELSLLEEVITSLLKELEWPPQAVNASAKSKDATVLSFISFVRSLEEWNWYPYLRMVFRLALPLLW